MDKYFSTTVRQWKDGINNDENYVQEMSPISSMLRSTQNILDEITPAQLEKYISMEEFSL